MCNASDEEKKEYAKNLSRKLFDLIKKELRKDPDANTMKYKFDAAMQSMMESIVRMAKIKNMSQKEVMEMVGDIYEATNITDENI